MHNLPFRMVILGEAVIESALSAVQGYNAEVGGWQPLIL